MTFSSCALRRSGKWPEMELRRKSLDGRRPKPLHFLKQGTNMKTESKDLAIQKAMTELTGVRKAAVAAGRRMQALERQADEIHTRTMIS
jgi:hypothetical protein